MCGICGIIDSNTNKRFEREVICRMNASLSHRGPDDEGMYMREASPFLGLGHRRLSIIDLSKSGQQPMSNEDNTVRLVFNGEIYNYKELKEELINKGHTFKSNTDSETLIHLYEERGEEVVKYLRGMFAFAIWDERKDELFLARDRLGQKPLLYYHKDNLFCFASEFSSLLESGLIEKKINRRAIDYYLTFGYVPAPLTIYEDVYKLPAAYTLTLKDGKASLRQYWQLDYAPKFKLSEDEAAPELVRLLKEAVKIRLYSDVPLGVFLSGGMDSSMVVALMSELAGKRIKTFSIGFEEQDYSELHYARSIAERFNTEHREFIVRPRALDILPLLVERYGEPYADSSCIPTYYVSRQTRQFVTVALNGDGGDESFAGYERYQAMLIAERMPRALNKMIKASSALLPDSINSKNNLRRIKRFFEAASLPKDERYVRWAGIFNEGLKRDLYSNEFLCAFSGKEPLEWMSPYLNNSNGLGLLDSLLRLDTGTYLPNDLLVKVDIASMANSLEARSPFLDHKLMEFAARLPAQYKMKKFVRKYILKRIAKGILPQRNISRPKMGFGVPVGAWFRNELKDLLHDAVLSERSLKRGYFNPQTVKHMVKQHINKEKDYSFQLWALLMLELWHQRFID